MAQFDLERDGNLGLTVRCDHGPMPPGLPPSSPRDAVQSGLRDVPDQEIPLVAAQWLAEGFDSAELWELAALSSADRVEARHALAPALASIGFPVVEQDFPWEDLPWRGY